jgi:mRNA-degrading endonuclease RelE of RelBE toxin-antitoxin system
VSWSVAFTPHGLRDLSALPAADVQRVIRSLKQSMGDPQRSFARLQGEPQAWRLRVGDLRVVARLDEARKSVEVLGIGHRSTVYR